GAGLSWPRTHRLNRNTVDLKLVDEFGTVSLPGRLIWAGGDRRSGRCGVQFSPLAERNMEVLERWFIMGTEYLEATVEETIGSSEDPETTKRIRTWFSEDVRRYCQRLSELEGCVGRTVQRTTPNPKDEDLRQEFAQLCDGILERGEQLLQRVHSRRTQRLVKRAFRRILSPWTAGNPFIERCLMKPRGYPGDYMMMEMGYAFRPRLGDGLSGMFDRYFSDVYECVRYRKDIAKERLRRLVTQESSSPLRILSMGGGPCREWLELEQELPSNRTFRPVQFSCLDQDQEALDFARGHLSKNRLLTSVEYLRETLLSLSDAKKWTDRAQVYDFIYGMGIANYFYDETLTDILRGSFFMLKHGGELVVEHKDRERFRFAPADWLCDWTFVKRNEQGFSKVLLGALSGVKGTVDWRVERDRTGELVFGIARRI
ncbi:MAG: PilZ domain-containing protein, partial [Candidatus Omnitrophica bacterium]|nr:PilZ domain-containing protein [Candidatus Omnitrophota bacterium]